MGSTLVKAYYHVVFSTKARRNFIRPEVQPVLYSYIGGTARNHKMAALAVGGTANHVHILLVLPSTLCIADAVRTIKAGSSKWLRETQPSFSLFEWQRGYGAFTLGHSELKAVVNYINHQDEHHRRESFEDEFIRFLVDNEVEYDPQYVLD